MENQDYTQATEQQAPVEMIEIKFSRKLARPFTTKNGKDMVANLLCTFLFNCRNITN